MTPADSDGVQIGRIAYRVQALQSMLIFKQPEIGGAGAWLRVIFGFTQ